MSTGDDHVHTEAAESSESLEMQSAAVGQTFRITGMQSRALNNRLQIIRSRSEYMFRHAVRGDLPDASINHVLRHP